MPSYRFLIKKTFSLYPREQKTSKKTSLFFLHDVTSGLVFFSKSPVYGLVRNHVMVWYIRLVYVVDGHLFIWQTSLFVKKDASWLVWNMMFLETFFGRKRGMAYWLQTTLEFLSREIRIHIVTLFLRLNQIICILFSLLCQELLEII